MRYCYPRILTHADIVVAVSHGVAKDFANLAGIDERRVEVVYNPVLSSDLGKRMDEPVSEPWFTESAIPIVLAIGRLTKQKDFQTLIRAFAGMKRRQNARLVILGEGEDRPQLESLCRELGLEQSVSLPGKAFSSSWPLRAGCCAGQ